MGDMTWGREWAEQHRPREVGYQRSRMTLGEATETLNAGPIACACVGGQGCCLIRGIAATDLQRGAHIVAKLLASAGQRGRDA